ncbi:hypothetical protein K438DRAFT_1969105 [Mycena galopus ATCC 62051]|nr:hypothetical protein K438DRAFT_1969105 [Mycena galopus ATCC 62051]
MLTTQFMDADGSSHPTAVDANDTSDPTCIPEYYPHGLHSTHSRDAHSRKTTCWFYVILRGRMCAAFSSMAQVEPLIKDFDDALYYEARTWAEVLECWHAFCLKQHSHCSPPPSPASCSDAFTVSSPLPSRGNSPCSFFDEHPASPLPARIGSPVKRTGKTRPPSAPSSPRNRSPAKRTHRTESIARAESPTKPARTRTSGAEPQLRFPRPMRADTPNFLPFPANMLEEIQGNISASARVPTALLTPAAIPRTLTSLAEAAWLDVSALVLPEAVHPVQRPIAEAPTRVIDIDDFVDSDVDESDITQSDLSDSTRSALPPTYQAPMDFHTVATPSVLFFGISGHQVIYRDRDAAFTVFQATAASEFWIAASLDEVQQFIGQHWLAIPPPVFALSGLPIVMRDLRCDEVHYL